MEKLILLPKLSQTNWPQLAVSQRKKWFLRASFILQKEFSCDIFTVASELSLAGWTNKSDNYWHHDSIIGGSEEERLITFLEASLIHLLKIKVSEEPGRPPSARRLSQLRFQLIELYSGKYAS